jgi:hypothetical protein
MPEEAFILVRIEEVARRFHKSTPRSRHQAWKHWLGTNDPSSILLQSIARIGQNKLFHWGILFSHLHMNETRRNLAMQCTKKGNLTKEQGEIHRQAEEIRSSWRKTNVIWSTHDKLKVADKFS